jgi:uncharacterized membrane protein YdjX (TVP38/TMEM64 family)
LPDEPDEEAMDGRHRFSRYRSVLLAILALAAALLLAWAGGLFSLLSDPDRLHGMIVSLGPAGPVALVLVEALAVVAAPLPSAPVAVAAGAAYGSVWGTVLVVAGAELGSLTAFLIARRLGYAAIRRHLPAGRFLARLESERSQTVLMALVFASRLVPFLSFDAVSYAAGLTPLAFWRFAAATLAGVVPIAFLLAYAGAEALDAGPVAIGAVLGLLMLTGAAPFAAAALRRLLRRGGEERPEPDAPRRRSSPRQPRPEPPP